MFSAWILLASIYPVGTRHSDSIARRCVPLLDDPVGQVATIHTADGLVPLGQALVAQLVGAASGQLQCNKSTITNKADVYTIDIWLKS